MANKRVTDLAHFREQMLENRGGAGYEFNLTWTDDTGENTEMFFVPHPLSTSDEQDAAVEAAQALKSGRGPGVAKALLNTEDDPRVYERFKAAGGQANDVMLVWSTMMDEMQGANLPK